MFLFLNISRYVCPGNRGDFWNIPTYSRLTFERTVQACFCSRFLDAYEYSLTVCSPDIHHHLPRAFIKRISSTIFLSGPWAPIQLVSSRPKLLVRVTEKIDAFYNANSFDSLRSLCDAQAQKEKRSAKWRETPSFASETCTWWITASPSHPVLMMCIFYVHREWVGRRPRWLGCRVITLEYILERFAPICWGQMPFLMGWLVPFMIWPQFMSGNQGESDGQRGKWKMRIASPIFLNNSLSKL